MKRFADSGFVKVACSPFYSLRPMCVFEITTDIFTCVNRIMILYSKRDLFLRIFVSMWWYELNLISYPNMVGTYGIPEDTHCDGL